MAVVLPPEPQYVLVAGFGTHWLLVTCRLGVLQEFGFSRLFSQTLPLLGGT